MTDPVMDVRTALDVLYDSNKADSFLLDVFRRSTFKGRLTESEYTYRSGQVYYVARSLKAHGTVRVYGRTYYIDVTISEDGVTIGFGDTTVDYYPKWDKFYKIYDELRKGHVVLLTPQDFKDLDAGKDKIALTCENAMKILQEIFRKVKVKCEIKEGGKEEKAKEAAKGDGKEEKEAEEEKVDFISDEDRFFDENEMIFEEL